MEKWTVQDALGSLEQEAQLTKGRKQEEEEEDGAMAEARRE